MRFFGTAVASHAAAWVALVVTAEAVPSYDGGPGTVAGPSICSRVGIIAAGAGLLVLSVALYVTAVLSVLRAGSGLRLVRMHVLAALACLGLGVLLALLLAIDYGASVLPDHRTVAILHMTLMAYGFLGILALGLSQILVPMFAITEPAEGPLPAAALALTLSALAVAAAALLADRAAFIAAAAALGLAGLACHVIQIEAMLGRRMRRRLGGEFQLIRASWLMLAASLLIAAGLALDLPPAPATALFGFLTLFGWLLSLVIGVQQRILAFLGSMHVLRAAARPLAPTKLVNERCLQVHRWCHFAALGLVAAGILISEPAPIRLGGSAGFIGALTYGLFALTVLQRTRHHLATAAIPAAKDTVMTEQTLLSELLHREHLHTLAVAGDLEARADDKRAGPIDVADAADRARLEALIGVADLDILKHYRFEEDVLFPRLVAAGLAPVIDVLVMEHEAVRAIAVPLRAAAEAALRDGFDVAGWRAFREGIFDLVSSVSFHIQKEELAVVRQLATVLGADADRELGAVYARSA